MTTSILYEHRFTHTYRDEDGSELTVEVVTNAMTLSDLLKDIESYLSACGFQVPYGSLSVDEPPRSRPPTGPLQGPPSSS